MSDHSPYNRATARIVLNLPLAEDNDAEAKTVRDYLIKLLSTLWRKADDFSGKRPFGRAGWDYDLYVPLLKAGLIDGELDAYGGVEQVDEKHGDALIHDAIAELGQLTAEALAAAEPPACTGLTARWCPVHGKCGCPEDGITELRIAPTLDDPKCPLHAPTSGHAEPATAQEPR